MSFLLDTNTVSVHLRRPAGLAHRFIQHAGRLSISTVSLAELYVWAYRPADPRKRLGLVAELLADVQVLPFEGCAVVFGQLRATALNSGRSVPVLDLMIASVALVHDLTLVTHNTGDFADVPRLRLEDWIAAS